MVRLGMAICLVVALAGCVSRGESAGGAAPNRAVVDAARTSEVLDAVREGIRVAFTVESGSIDDRPEQIKPYVTAAGARAADQLMAEDLADAESQFLNASIDVADAAVSELVGDNATVLVVGAKVREDTTRFTEQRSMLIGAKQVDGTWKIDSVDDHVLPASQKLPKTSGDSLAAERDSAIEAGREIAATLISFDDDDVDGSVTKWLSVTTEPLTGRRKAIPDDELERYGTKRVTPATSFGAAMAVEPGRVTALLAMSAENVDQVQQLSYDHLCWISLVRDSKDNWKARDFRDVDAVP